MTPILQPGTSKLKALTIFLYMWLMQESNRIAESTASLTDSILHYRQIHGRTFQNSKTTEYW
jgi:hypothetical protein